MKKLAIGILLAGTVLFTTLNASAEQRFAYVDMAKVLNGSSKAQEISASVKAQQNEIQKMITDAKNQLQATKNDKDRSELEKKLTDQIQQKNNVFKADYEKKVQTLETSIVSTVKQIAQEKKIDCIFKKDNILVGGEDITDQVLSGLNK